MTVFTGTLPEWLVEPVLAADLESMADALDALNDAWTTYVPVWTTSGTAPALGNGLITGRYLRVGSFVLANVNWVPGSTSTFGTGDFHFSMPVTNASGFDAIGSSILLDSGTTRYTASCTVLSSTSYAGVVPGSTNYIQATTPFTWTTNDSVQLQIIYQA